MTPTHTPGPWTLETVPTSCGSCHRIGPFPSRNDQTGYACVYADGIRIGVDEGNTRAVELLANARLISAAPELLEALKCLVATDPRRAPRPGMSEPDELINARAAIAKAEGRS